METELGKIENFSGTEWGGGSDVKGRLYVGSAVAIKAGGRNGLSEDDSNWDEDRAAVIHAISHLRESLRTVVLLRELQELTSAETARRLGLTVSAVKASTFHARRYLRRHFEQKYKAAPGGSLIGTRSVNAVRRAD